MAKTGKQHKPVKKEREAEVTLSGLRVRSDEETQEIIPWYRLSYPQPIGDFRVRLVLVDRKGKPVRDENGRQSFVVKGLRAKRLCGRAYFRGLKLAFQRPGLEFEIECKPDYSAFGLAFLALVSILMIGYLLGVVVPKKIGTFWIIPDEVTEYYSAELLQVMFVTRIIIVVVLSFLAYRYCYVLGMSARLYFSSRRLCASASSLVFNAEGLKCRHKECEDNHHAWKDLLPSGYRITPLQFLDGYSIWLPTSQPRIRYLIRTVRQIHDPSYKPFRFPNLFLSYGICAAILIPAFLFFSHAMAICWPDCEKLRLSALLFTIFICCLLFMPLLKIRFKFSEHPACSRIRKRLRDVFERKASRLRKKKQVQNDRRNCE